MAKILKYQRCWNCQSLLELEGTFNIFAQAPYPLKCPVCSKVNDVENFGSYNYVVKSIPEQREIGQSGYIKVTPMEQVTVTPTPLNLNPLGFLSKIGDSFKGIGIWIVVVLVLWLLISWKRR